MLFSGLSTCSSLTKNERRVCEANLNNESRSQVELPPPVTPYLFIIISGYAAALPLISLSLQRSSAFALWLISSYYIHGWSIDLCLFLFLRKLRCFMTGGVGWLSTSSCRFIQVSIITSMIYTKPAPRRRS